MPRIPSANTIQTAFVAIAQTMTAEAAFAVYEAAVKSVAFVIAGLAAIIFFPALAPPLFIIAGVIVATRLVIKIGNVYNVEIIDKVQTFLAYFRDKHKYIQLAALIGILAVALFSWPAACVLAVPFGIYAGVVIGLDYYVSVQEGHRRRERAGPPGREAKAVYLI